MLSGFTHIPMRLIAALVLVGMAVTVAPAATAAESSPTSLLAFDRYTSPGMRIILMSPDGTAETKLAGNWLNPKWSPDGLRLAVMGDDGHDGEVFLITADGELITQVTATPGDERSMTWSPDGKRLAYISGKVPGDLWVINADGTGARQITSDLYIQNPKWSPDGRRILYSGWSRERMEGFLGSIRADGADADAPRRIETLGWSLGAPDFSPDGSKIAYTRYRDVTNSQYEYEIVTAAVDGSDPVVLVTAPKRIETPVWSPDGTTIAFGMGEHQDVYTIPATGGEMARITQTATSEANISWGTPASCTKKGTDGADVLTGTNGDDVICARGGDDRVLPSGGTDVVIGGLGMDKIDFRERKTGVAVDLRQTHIGDTTLLGIESVLGTAYDDVIFGNDSRNMLAGYGGNDALIGRGGDDTLNAGDGDDVLRPGLGSDDLNGGDGRDTASFIDALERVRVNLGDGFAFGSGQDILLRIEKVIGSPFDDFVVGDNGRNVLRGGDGEDTLDGLAGPDDVYGGDDRDFLYGRGGEDDLYGDDGRDYVDGGGDDDDCFSAFSEVSC